MALPQIAPPEPAEIEWGNLPRRFLNPGELEVLVALAQSVRPKAVLEIGCNSGRTARALLDNVPSIETYQGIDVPPGYQFAKRVQRNEVPANPGEWALGDPRFELILRTRGSLELSADDLEPCDLVFIDGDHGREAVMHDTALARQLVRPGGLIVWHDYHQLGTVDVQAVIEEMAAAGDEIMHVTGTWFAIERIAPCG